MWASRAASKAWLNVEELAKLVKWARVPQSCDNNPKPLGYFSLAGISLADRSPLSSSMCAARAWTVWLCVALRADCGREICDSQSSGERSSHFTITREIIIPWPQTQRQPYQQDLGFSKHDCLGMFSQHFSKVTYMISFLLVEATLDLSQDSYTSAGKTKWNQIIFKFQVIKSLTYLFCNCNLDRPS